MMTIISCLERYRLDITTVQEVRWNGSGSIKTHGFTILYSGEEKHERSVGFTNKNKYLPNVKFKLITDKICDVNLSANG